MDPDQAASQTMANSVDMGTIVLAIILVLIGFVLSRLSSRAIVRTLSSPFGNHRTLILQRVVSYGVFTLFAVSALHQVGVELSVLLGAAGILTVAIGFAAQTAASNFVSGVFLLGEGPFEVGETIEVANITGEVLSIDLMSIRLRTFDNLLIRIPNEAVMKSSVANYSRFPIRRHDLKLFVDPVVDLDVLEEVLLSATLTPIILAEPKSIVIFQGFTESGLQVQVSAWALRENFLEMRNQLHRNITVALQTAKIPLGYPNRVLETRPHDDNRVRDSASDSTFDPRVPDSSTRSIPSKENTQ